MSQIKKIIPKSMPDVKDSYDVSSLRPKKFNYLSFRFLTREPA